MQFIILKIFYLNYFCLCLQSKVVFVGKLVCKQIAKYKIYSCELRQNIALSCGFGGVSCSCNELASNL